MARSGILLAVLKIDLDEVIQIRNDQVTSFLKKGQIISLISYPYGPKIAANIQLSKHPPTPPLFHPLPDLWHSNKDAISNRRRYQNLEQIPLLQSYLIIRDEWSDEICGFPFTKLTIQ